MTSPPTCTARERLHLAYDNGYFCMLAGPHTARRSDLEAAIALVRSTALRLVQGPGYLIMLSPHQINVSTTVTVETWDEPAPEDTCDWQEVCEASIELDGRGIEFYSPPAVARLPAPPPGRYTVRVAGRGFHAQGWPGTTTPGDTWRLQFWPAAAAAPPRRIATWPGPQSRAAVCNRANALRALLDPDPAPTPPPVLLDSVRPVEHPAVRAVAVTVLAEGWAVVPSVAALLRRCAADDPDPLTRRAAVQGLARTPPHADTQAVLVDRAIADEDGAVRAAAVDAAAVAVPDDPATLAWLQQLAEGTDPDVQGAAVRALGRGQHRDPAVLAWLRALADDTTSIRRWDAFQAIGAGWPGDPAILDWLYRHATTGDQDTSDAAFRTLAAGWAGNTQVLAFLKRFVVEGPPSARSSALAAVHVGWASDPQAHSWLHAHIQTRPDQIMSVPLRPREDPANNN